MKKIFLILIILIVMFLLYFLQMNRQVEQLNQSTNLSIQERQSNIENFILEHLMTDQGIIRTNFSGKKEGDVALSESLGLWMEYLSKTQDEEQFELAFQALKEQFQLESGIVSWKIENNKRATTNALIDDLRIIEALFRMGEKTNNETYIKEATNISKVIKSKQMLGRFFVDFYDEKHRNHNDFLTVSYINMDALRYMEKYKIVRKKFIKQMDNFLATLPTENLFYPQTFEVLSNNFIFEKEVNLIDQLYIALHLERAGIDTTDFFTWLQEEFYKDHHLYGRYDAEFKTPEVAYESVAVYALAVMYSLTRKEPELARDIYNQMRTLQVTDEKSPYFGGFVTHGVETTHSFDNLLALMAERELVDEKILP